MDVLSKPGHNATHCHATNFASGDLQGKENKVCKQNKTQSTL